MPFHLRRKRQPIGRGLGHLAPSRAALPFIALAVAMAALACSSSSTSDIRQSSASTVSDAVTYGDLPLAFEENRGQSADGVRFISRGNGFTAFMTPDGITLALRLRAPDGSGSLSDESVDYTTMGMRLVGANASPDVGGLRELGGKTNYFVSTEPAGWHLGVPSYSKVRYSEVYPGIDLVFFGNQRSLEYNFVLSPGSDPNLIGLSFQGADSVSLDEDGNLALAIGGGTVLHQAPVTYQVSDGGIREIVDSRYTLRAVAGDEAGAGDYQIGFELGAYDHSRGLVIDPEISYSSYLGGNKLDWSSDIALDSEGYAYIVGYTTSPRTFDVGGLSGELAGDVDIFVAKFSKDGGELVYATYLGGSEDDKGLAIAVDEGGAAFITGLTESEDYPVTVGAFRDRFPKGQTSSFITKLNPSGDALDYSTYVGGRSGNGIAIDSEGNAYITGHATASDFPTTIGSFQPDYVHGFEAFIAKLNAEGSALAYATYLGGEGADYGTAIAVDIDGDAYVTGRTNSDDFPTTAGAYSATNQGGVDVFVARLNQAGSELVYSTLLGGEEDDLGTDIALDSALNAYVTGETGSGDFPSENSLNDDFTDGAVDAFVTSIDPTGGSLVFSINVGAESVDIGNSIAVDRHGDIWVAGETDSSNMETEKPVQDDREGESDAFVVKLEAGGVRLLFSTFLGGSDNDIATGVAVDSSGSAYVTGVSYSTDFPIGDSVQEEPGGVGDAFVTKVSFSPSSRWMSVR